METYGPGKKAASKNSKPIRPNPSGGLGLRGLRSRGVGFRIRSREQAQWSYQQ